MKFILIKIDNEINNIKILQKLYDKYSEYSINRNYFQRFTKNVSLKYNNYTFRSKLENGIKNNVIIVLSNFLLWANSILIFFELNKI